MSLFPIFLKLHGRRCLVVGAGNVALEKISSLLQAQADIQVIAPAVCAAVEQLATEGRISLARRQFSDSDLDGQFLVVTATNSLGVNHDVFLAAQRRDILCNSVDDPPHCDFYFSSVVRRGDLQIAISTAGESPAFAQRLRREIDGQLPHDTGTWLAEIGRLRREILATQPAGEGRKKMLCALADRAPEKQSLRENDRKKSIGTLLCELEQFPSRQFGSAAAKMEGVR